MRARTRCTPVALVAAALVLGGCAHAVKPLPPAVYDGAKPAFDELAPELKTVDASILFVTDRKKEVDAYGREIYGIERSASLTYGSAVVRLKVGEGWDDLVAWTESREGAPAGSLSGEVVSVTEKGRFPATPYVFEIDEQGNRRLDPEVQREIDALVREALAVVSARLRLTPHKTVDIYIHGIQTQLDEFLVNVARDWHFGGRHAVPIAYSWPAGAPGLLSAYARDRESGEFTVPHLKQVIRSISQMPDVERVNLFAHSRGTDVVMSAVRELVIEARAAGIDVRKRFKIANIILMAPDLDMEVTEQRFGDAAIGSEVGRVTVYSNASDSAIGASQSLFSSRARLGNVEREALTERQLQMVRRSTNVDVVVYTGTGGGGFRHSYWRVPAVRADTVLVARDGREPGAENGRPLKKLGNHFWEIGDDYLR